MEQNLHDTVALLARTPAMLNALLRDLPEAWTMQNEGENSWTPFEIVGHLIHGEYTDWMARAKMIMNYGEARAFEPFDRLADPGAGSAQRPRKCRQYWASSPAARSRGKGARSAAGNP